MSALIHSFRPVLQPPPKLAMRPMTRPRLIYGSYDYESFTPASQNLR